MWFFCLLEYNAMKSVEIPRTLQNNMYVLSSESKNKDLLLYLSCSTASVV
jgi:hypothetical protein